MLCIKFLFQFIQFISAKGFNISRKDSICVRSTKGQDDIKAKLSVACKADKIVYIVKKFCNEEKKGTYFCLKDGRCVGYQCIGCVRHECDIDGKRYYTIYYCNGIPQRS